ncbi:MAG TPA: DEAD/DEAH box helicase [Planctomycetota bacterium]|nr:DEAD/DEAH box helicase [Planctomycetota bacterium]
MDDGMLFETEAEDEPAAPARELDDRQRIHRVLSLLDRRRFREAIEVLGPLTGPRAKEGLFWAMRCIGQAGLGDLQEAESDLAEARLRGDRGRWVADRLIGHASQAVTRLRADLALRARPVARPARRAPAPPPPTARVPARPEPATPAPEAEVRLCVTMSAAGADDVEPGLSAAQALDDFRLRREAHDVERLRRFDTLLALAAARGVDHYDYQLRTVRRVLRDFRGRALLADEVGLGKTIEACLCLVEYFPRGLVKRALVLVPPGLVGQWHDEIAGKLGREAVVVDSAAAREAGAWERDGVVLASTALARAEPHASRLQAARFDMVVVDEAHRLKNRTTKLWNLVDRLKSRFLLLLSATPVENDVFEIYNVLSLLRPGLFPTPAEFRKAFVEPGRRTPKDPARLRQLLREVMVRNTRAVAEARLPPRFAATLRAAPTPEEAAFYADLVAAVRAGVAGGTLSRFAAGEVLRAAGSRPAACAGLVARHLGDELAARARSLSTSGKDAVLADLLARRRDDKAILFTTHRDTLEHLRSLAERAGRRAVVFHGSLTPREKSEAVARFAAEADLLVASESGGEGFNLHVARTVINYDLPWNPMRIEQRIGRVHRIGQARDVFVFNLVAEGTVEEEILRVLDEKVAMFELVVGEVEAILGRLGDDEREFRDLVLDAYADAHDAADVRARFDALAARMSEAKSEHVRVRALEERTFGRDLEA